MRLKWKLFVASLKMFFRQKEAIIWTILLPVLMIVLFGFVRFDSFGQLDIGIVGAVNAENFVGKLKGISTVNTHSGMGEEELHQLQKGERDAVIVLPPGFDASESCTLVVHTNLGRPQQSQLALLILQRLADEQLFASNAFYNRIVFKEEAVNSRNLTYMDFLLPGVVAMSIMQMGIFGVAFGFVSLKKRGILRRLSVTPVKPDDFIFAQVAMRLLVVVIQMTLLVSIGVMFFDLHLSGNLLEMFIVGIVGAVVFLGIGFALAGASTSEDQVAPLANIIAMPMMFLSGIFFGRDTLPDIVHTIAGFFPLTYLVDAMRSIAIDGATVFQVGPQLAGLVIWGVISCILAVKIFKWE